MSEADQVEALAEGLRAYVEEGRHVEISLHRPIREGPPKDGFATVESVDAVAILVTVGPRPRG